MSVVQQYGVHLITVRSCVRTSISSILQWKYFWTRTKIGIQLLTMRLEPMTMGAYKLLQGVCHCTKGYLVTQIEQLQHIHKNAGPHFHISLKASKISRSDLIKKLVDMYRKPTTWASSDKSNIPCNPTNMTTLVFPFFGVKEGFPGSNISQSSLKMAYKKKNLLILGNK